MLNNPLFVVDVFTKYALVKPLKDKKRSDKDKWFY